MNGEIRPTIVCLCGSTRFSAQFRAANLQETLAGKIVLSVGCDMRSDDDVFAQMTEEEKQTTKKALDALHLRKIDLADEVLILNLDGYVGESTRRELAYARSAGKHVRFLEPDKALLAMQGGAEGSRVPAVGSAPRAPLGIRAHGRC